MAGIRRKTLRKMSPTSRQLARLIGELDSVSRRAKNLLPKIQQFESDSRALFNRKEWEKEQPKAEAVSFD